MFITKLLIGLMLISLRNADHLEADYFLESECSSDYKCSIAVLPDDIRKDVSIYFRKYNNVRILYIENSDPIISNTYYFSNLKIIYTKTYVWLRRFSLSDNSLDTFERLSRSEIEPATQLKKLGNSNVNSFYLCVYYTNAAGNQSEINCNWSDKKLNRISDLHVYDDYINPKFTYLNLAGKEIDNFDHLPSKFSYPMKRVNLMNTQIKTKKYNFLMDFVNVRQLDLPDSLFGYSVTKLFQKLNKLALIVTPGMIYWRDDKDSFEMFNRTTRCFLSVSFSNENRHDKGCLANRTKIIENELNSYWMNQSSLFVAIDKYFLIIVISVFSSLILISVLLTCRGCNKRA